MIQTYQEAISYLYEHLPVFQHIGPAAYKKDLGNTIQLCKQLGDPQRKFKSIHVAGTNGKGSSSHMLAAILQTAGYKTGLYTSPHLKDFTERIKINGQEIDKNFVRDFVRDMQQAIEEIKPSFFELTVAMAFDYFVKENVDLAVIETGLGGRLDSTNVINPEVSLITNIGFDHMDILGNTLAEIASEKAGIIKPGRPVVISERQTDVEQIFIDHARGCHSKIYFASDEIRLKPQGDELFLWTSHKSLVLRPELKGEYQFKNIGGVVRTCETLNENQITISDESIMDGINKTVTLTGLKGRWQTIRRSPLVICDTGHNEDGIKEVIDQINITPHEKLKWVFGVVKDKSPDRVLSLLPKSCHYYFCQAKIPRAMDAHELMERAAAFNLSGTVVSDVNDALAQAINSSSSDDLIMVGGSTFVVAEVNEI